MKKLNRFRRIGLTGIGIAVILEVLGVLSKTTALSIIAFVILLLNCYYQCCCNRNNGNNTTVSDNIFTTLNGF